MEHKKTLRIWGGFLLLLLLTIVFLIWNLFAGSVRLSASEILEILRGGAEGSQRSILLQIRLPRLVAALILGGALSRLGLSAANVFPQPHRKPLRPRHFLRRKAHDCRHHDRAFIARAYRLVCGSDRSGVSGRDGLDGLCPLPCRRRSGT